uniref:ANK_REP_REGION domain-containing protein n=1 Tax=Macrostomum lignano TaxID=282301 RepID=A0A1I8JRQ2_9PLAT
RADPSNRDQLGNSVLHMLVIHNQTEVYRLALRHYKRPADPTAVNHAGLNPISLAAKLGRRRVFNENHRATEMWRYGDIACKLYPLTGVDTIGPNGHTDWDSAFMHIINGQTSEHLDMLDEGVIRQLLSAFLQRLALTIAYLSIMTLAVYLRPQENWNVSSNSTGIVRVSLQVNGQNVVRYICEIITVINSGLTIYFMINEIREQGFRAFTRSLSHAPPRAVYIVACFLITLVLPARLGVLFWSDNWQTMTLVEESLLILAIPCVWTYLLFFASAQIFMENRHAHLQNASPKFSPFYFLFRNIEQITIGSFQDVLTTVMTVFQMTHGEFKMSKGEFLIKNSATPTIPLMSKCVFAIFMIIMPIMLLNMIIAMMNHTYSTVNARSQKESIAMVRVGQDCGIVERSFNSQQLLAYRTGYTIPVPGKEGEFGLMTIYRTKKTLAKQRVTAQCNWK